MASENGNPMIDPMLPVQEVASNLCPYRHPTSTEMQLKPLLFVAQPGTHLFHTSQFVKSVFHLLSLIFKLLFNGFSSNDCIRIYNAYIYIYVALDNSN